MKHQFAEVQLETPHSFRHQLVRFSPISISLSQAMFRCAGPGSNTTKYVSVDVRLECPRLPTHAARLIMLVSPSMIHQSFWDCKRAHIGHWTAILNAFDHSGNAPAVVVKSPVEAARECRFFCESHVMPAGASEA